MSEQTDNRITISEIQNHKGRDEALVCLTAYTYPMAQILDNHASLLLVGDSLGMVLYGMNNTLSVDLEMMIAHGKAVMRGVKKACVVIDMPFGTYESNPEQAYRTAARLMEETGCDGVKLEGGLSMASTISYLTQRHIPVLAHIGLQPQSVLKEGGYKVKGKQVKEAQEILEDGKAVEAAGAFGVVIEGTIDEVATEITHCLHIPTIGIGASPKCDGQILVSEDMLGMVFGHTPKFVKKFADIAFHINQAADEYAQAVKSRNFPGSENLYIRSDMTLTSQTKKVS